MWLAVSENVSLSYFRRGPDRFASSLRRCCGGRSSAKAFRASSRKSRSPKSTDPWYFDEPVLVMISIRPRPGRAYSAEYGLLLILTSWISDARRFWSELGSPSITTVGPPDPTDAGSSNRARAP